MKFFTKNFKKYKINLPFKGVNFAPIFTHSKPLKTTSNSGGRLSKLRDFHALSENLFVYVNANWHILVCSHRASCVRVRACVCWSQISGSVTERGLGVAGTEHVKKLTKKKWEGEAPKLMRYGWLLKWMEISGGNDCEILIVLIEFV